MELVRALGALCEPLSPLHRPAAEALRLPGEPRSEDHTALFVFDLYPYACVYLSAEGKLGGAARDRVAGFWRALRLVPPSEPDHLAALLGLYATLGEHEHAEPDEARRRLVREARRTLLHEHLLSWAEPYLDRVTELAPPYYRAWAELLREVLAVEAEELGAPAALPAALREAPPLEEPSAVGGTAFVEQLLAPARTGIILVRSDLLAAARELALGLRIAERRYALEALLGQDAAATLRWLSRFAARRAGRHTSTFWAGRASACAALLAEAAAHAEVQDVPAWSAPATAH